MTLIDLAILVCANAFVAGAVYGAIRVDLRYMRRDIDAAHRRLDKIHAPAAWGTK